MILQIKLCKSVDCYTCTCMCYRFSKADFHVQQCLYGDEDVLSTDSIVQVFL